MISLLAALVLAPKLTCKICGEHYSANSVLTRPQFNVHVTKAAARTKTKLNAADRAALYNIVYRESRLNRNAQNSRSSAYGLGGLLNATWKNVGLKKTDCPNCQLEAMLRYIARRYRSPTRALDHHRRKRWY